MNFFELTKSELRNIIIGKTQYKKCLCCDNDGKEYWDESGVSVLPYPHPSWGTDYSTGDCENCVGLGFVKK